MRVIEANISDQISVIQIIVKRVSLKFVEQASAVVAWVRRQRRRRHEESVIESKQRSSRKSVSKFSRSTKISKLQQGTRTCEIYEERIAGLEHFDAENGERTKGSQASRGQVVTAIIHPVDRGICQWKANVDVQKRIHRVRQIRTVGIGKQHPRIRSRSRENDLRWKAINGTV